jgi:hypothetical protein
MRSITEQARDAYASDSCVQCGNIKLARRDWFCHVCWPKLPENIQKSLKYLNKDWKEQFLEALKVLEIKQG